MAQPLTACEFAARKKRWEREHQRTWLDGPGPDRRVDLEPFENAAALLALVGLGTLLRKRSGRFGAV